MDTQIATEDKVYMQTHIEPASTHPNICLHTNHHTQPQRLRNLMDHHMCITCQNILPIQRIEKRLHGTKFRFMPLDFNKYIETSSMESNSTGK